MTEHTSDTVGVALTELEAAEKEMLNRALVMMRADDGAVYPFDLFAHGAINRSLALSAGFRTLIRDRNLICAGAILRLQLDTAIRFFAGFIVDKPHDFATEVLKGTPSRKMKDKNGQPMTDWYLVTQLAKEYPWIEPLYKKTSGYVHMSDTHILSTFDGVNDETRVVGIKIGWRDKNMPDSLYLEAIAAFRELTTIFARYVDGWIFTKANPVKVAQMRAEREKANPPT